MKVKQSITKLGIKLRILVRDYPAHIPKSKVDDGLQMTLALASGLMKNL